MPSPNVVTVMQARMSSTRMPGKIMQPLVGNKPLLLHMAERVQAAQHAGTVVIATTSDPADKPIVELCQRHNLLCLQGHPTDLLDRHYQAGVAHHADVVVKIPSDCPLIDPAIIDRVIGVYLAEPDQYDFVSNLHPATYPDGNDVEVMRMSALATAWQEATQDFEREHTTPFFWEQPKRFRHHNVTWETGLDYSMSHRWTIDYEADYHFIRAVYQALYPQNPLFTINDILQLLTQQPDLMQLNGHLAGVNWYRHHLDALQTVDQAQTRLEPTKLESST